MSIVTAFILLGLLIVVGVVVVKFLPRKRSIANKKVNNLEDLLERKKDSNLKLPIFLYALLVSLLFTSWIFDSNYRTLVEKKLFTSPVEKLDSIFEMAIVLPAPPKVKPPEVKPEIKPDPPKDPEIKEVKKVEKKEPKKIELNKIAEDLDFEGEGEDTEAKQAVDNTTYMPGQVNVIPSCAGLKDFLQSNFGNMRPPVKYIMNNRSYKVTIFFVVEKDGTLTEIKINRRNKDDLSEKQQKKIIETFKRSPLFTPGKRIDQPVRVRLKQTITLNP